MLQREIHVRYSVMFASYCVMFFLCVVDRPKTTFNMSVSIVFVFSIARSQFLSLWKSLSKVRVTPWRGQASTGVNISLPISILHCCEFFFSYQSRHFCLVFLIFLLSWASTQGRFETNHRNRSHHREKYLCFVTLAGSITLRIAWGVREIIFRCFERSTFFKRLNKYAKTSHFFRFNITPASSRSVSTNTACSNCVAHIFENDHNI